MPTPRSGYIYLIGSERFSWYKIGMSAIPDVRVRDIGILLPFKMEVLAVWFAEDRFKAEIAMHEKYAERAINGEWFHFKKRELPHILSDGTPFFGHRVELGMHRFSNMEKDSRNRDFEPMGLFSREAYLQKWRSDCLEFLRINCLPETPGTMKFARKSVSRQRKLDKKTKTVVDCCQR